MTPRRAGTTAAAAPGIDQGAVAPSSGGAGAGSALRGSERGARGASGDDSGIVQRRDQAQPAPTLRARQNINRERPVHEGRHRPQQLQRLEHQLARPIVPGPLQQEGDAAVGTSAQALLREGRPQDVAAHPLQPARSCAPIDIAGDKSLPKLRGNAHGRGRRALIRAHAAFKQRDPQHIEIDAPECVEVRPRWARNGHARDLGANLPMRKYLEGMVGRDGIEPPTPGFSVLCSTN